MTWENANAVTQLEERQNENPITGGPQRYKTASVEEKARVFRLSAAAA